MATRIMDESAYKKHQAKFGRKAAETLLRTAGTVMSLAGAKKRSKFGNVKTVVDGAKLDSKREAKRYRELGLLFKSGEIDFLARQVRFYLSNGITYIADFVYGETLPIGNKQALFKITVEDAKGVRTPEFKIKAKLMKAEYGIDVVEV